jgi:hypothetical protein
METLFLPRFGASLSVKIAEAEPTAKAQAVHQAFIEAQDAFSSRIGNINDKRDPLSLTVEVNYLGNAQGTISSSENGTIKLDFLRDLQTPQSFLNTLVSRAEAKAQNLKPTVVNAKLLLAGLRKALQEGTARFLESGPGSCQHEVGFHLASSRAVAYEINGERYVFEQEISKAERKVSYSIHSPTQSFPLFERGRTGLYYQGYPISLEARKDGIQIGWEDLQILFDDYTTIVQTLEAQGVFNVAP